jgi:Cysteine rich repeat
VAVVVVAAGLAVAAAAASGDGNGQRRTGRGKRMIRITPMNGAKLLAGLLLFGLAGAAGAQQPSQAQIGAVKQSCRSDYQSYCSSVPTGGSAALQCLKGNMASLSPSCQTAVSAATGGGGSTRPPAQASQGMPGSGASPSGPPPAMPMREEMGLMRRSCGGDFRAYCQGVRPGGGRAIACLSENQTRLSPQCRGALAEAQSGR